MDKYFPLGEALVAILRNNIPKLGTSSVSSRNITNGCRVSLWKEGDYSRENPADLEILLKEGPQEPVLVATFICRTPSFQKGFKESLPELLTAIESHGYLPLQEAPAPFSGSESYQYEFQLPPGS